MRATTTTAGAPTPAAATKKPSKAISKTKDTTGEGNNREHLLALVAGKTPPTPGDAAVITSLVHRAGAALLKSGVSDFGKYVDPEGGTSTSPTGAGLMRAVNRRLKSAFGPVDEMSTILKGFVGLLRMQLYKTLLRMQSQGALREDVRQELYQLVDDAAEMVSKTPLVFGGSADE
jgi:hypothetical protein